MIEDLKAALQQKCEVSSGDKILVGVSGGVDSMVLLHALSEAGFPVVAAHLNHRLREGSAQEAEFVRSSAEKLGVPFVSGKVDTVAYSREEKLSLEEAARELRYTFLFSAAVEHSCKAVAVGHHADDQAETILLHLVRGTGLNGLGGMAYRRITQWHLGIPLIRPLLDTPRDELEQYCQGCNLQFIEDESNRDIRFLRNRIRYEVMPILRDMNPRIANRLGQMSEIIRDELRLLDQITTQCWGNIEAECTGYEVNFSREKFLEMERGIKRRLMRKAFGLLRPGLVDVGIDLIDRAVDAVGSPPVSGELDLAQGLRLEIRRNSVRMSAWGAEEDLAEFPQLSEDLAIEVQREGSYPIGGEWVVEVGPLESADLAQITANEDRFTTFLDLEFISGPIILRGRADGDWIAPLGMNGSRMKVSDLMINEQIPRQARGKWPVFDVGGEIIWVPGCRSSELVRVRPESSRVVKLSVKRRG